MRKVKKIHSAVSAPIHDLVTYRAMPTNSVEFIDPFLFLNHHGPQIYPPNNNGLPFGPHPHRGFETLTFIISGDVLHADSSGHESIIGEGGIQWMTAGSGIVHSELSSDTFKKNGGLIEIIQLWLNLPSKLKMIQPRYVGLQANELPKFNLNKNIGQITIVSGEWFGVKGPVNSVADIQLANILMLPGGLLTLEIPAERSILFYVVSGNTEVNGNSVNTRQLVEFENNNGVEITIRAISNLNLIIGHGMPNYEPIVAQGPFVMNSITEIKQAYADYQKGLFG